MCCLFPKGNLLDLYYLVSEILGVLSDPIAKRLLCGVYYTVNCLSEYGLPCVRDIRFVIRAKLTSLVGLYHIHVFLNTVFIVVLFVNCYVVFYFIMFFF